LTTKPTESGPNREPPPRKKRTSGKRKAKLAQRPIRDWKHLAILSGEVTGLSIAGLVLVISALGHAARWFGGVGLWSNLIPFAGSVLVLAVFAALLLWLWITGRKQLHSRAMRLPAIAAALVALGAGWFASREEFGRDLQNLRTLVGGTQEAERTTLSHQVFAAYRRSDLTQMQRIVERAEVYLPIIHEAADTYGVDPEVMVGVGATESSFYPRDSKDGGRGLFQITAPPKIALEKVKKRLSIDTLDLYNQRHNIFIAAATFQHYLAEMGSDLFLGLLAYNIGPQNGGLRSIMQHYGARDFVTIQPYLQNLPRDYPIRVLTSALAYRLWRKEGKLLRYEEGDNAIHIQNVGIPGLDQFKSKKAKTES
jgi:soluble lytic murein transglycosylase-like protein